MAKINILDHQTIDKIAAGEVVERPFSVVKELVENAIDSGANAITVEVKDGGISFIRVTDNGCGIEKAQVDNAFLRHATSKISAVEDLTKLVSLGFRGEALASIAAVSMVELITKVSGELTGIRYVIEGGLKKESEDVGAPDGTTVIVRNLFYNTPPRKKFLKQPQTEGSYITDLMEHLAMSNPKVSFKFMVNGQTKFFTTGKNDLYEVVYRIYGKEIARELTPFSYEGDSIRINGFLGKPVINRSNRNYELFYINGRYIRSTLISRAVEEGFREYLMQHKFPFCVLHFQIDTARIDVNVHPTKMEVRIAEEAVFYETVKNAVYHALREQEMIPEVILAEEKEETRTVKESIPEPFESRRLISEQTENLLREPAGYHAIADNTNTAVFCSTAQQYDAGQDPVPKQMELFDDKLLSAKAREQYVILGQLFDTYWLVAYQDKLLIIDQHAAHEKVKYERFLKRFQEHSIVSQTVNPPLIVTLSGKERECYEQHREDFTALGFVIEEFGGNDYAIRAVPLDLYGYGENEFFYEIMDELTKETVTGTPESIRIRIATMACKAAVKGNTKISREEMEQLIEELLSLDNPYNCPHGRPTIISMSKYELEKKFKRII